MPTSIRRKLLGALLAVSAPALCSVESFAQCSDSLLAQVPEAALAKGGLFYQAHRANEPHWEALAADHFMISGDLNLAFVVPPGLCERPDGTKRVDCGPHGFFLLKTHKNTGARAPETIDLAHGDQFSVVTGFPGAKVENDPYQRFHLDERTVSWRYRHAWHQTYRVNGEAKSTFLPLEKKLQFAFGDDLLEDGFRAARLFRFETPSPGDIVCAHFSVGWYEGMTLTTEFVLLDPVFATDAFLPKTFVLSSPTSVQ